MGYKIKGFVTIGTMRRKVAHNRRMAAQRREFEVACAIARTRSEMIRDQLDMEDLLKTTIAQVKLSDGNGSDFWIFGFKIHKQSLTRGPWPTEKAIKILAVRVKESVEDLLFSSIRGLDQTQKPIHWGQEP